MYMIIVGAGDLGEPLIDIATRAGHDVVVIERSDERADTIAQEYDCVVLNADATTKNTLVDAEAERAEAVISTTEQDATNIMVSLLATELEIPSIVSVVHEHEHMGIYRWIGVHTMENPQELLAEQLYRTVARPAIKDFMRIGEEAEVFEITVMDGSPLDGVTLAEAAEEDLLPEDVLIVAVEREDGETPLTPRGDTTIRAGDLVTVYSAFGAEPSLTDLFGHDEDHAE